MQFGKRIGPLARRVAAMQIPVYAGNASFFLLLSVFPVVSLLLSLLPYTPLTLDHLLAFCEEFAPDWTLRALEFFVRTLYASSSAAIISASAVLTLWSASKGMLSLLYGLDAVAEVRETRGYVQRRLLCVLYTVGMLLALLLTLGLYVGGQALLRFLTGPKTLLRLKRENIRLMPKLILPCVALGTATFIMQASESVISVCFNFSLLKYGGDLAVGAMTILSSVMQFAMLPLQGIAQGAQPITSYNYGAGNSSRVKESFLLLLKVCMTYSLLLWAAIMAFPGAFARIFTPEPELIAFTALALRVYCGALFLFGVQIACQMTFVSIGNAPCSILVAVLRKFILLLPLIFLLPHILPDKTMAVYTAEPVADSIAMTCTALLFFFQFRKALKKMDAGAAGKAWATTPPKRQSPAGKTGSERPPPPGQEP